jgi:hypothetical protein
VRDRRRRHESFLVICWHVGAPQPS